MKKSYALLTLLLCCLSLIHAQRPGGSRGQGGPSITGKITGTVLDTSTNVPVEFATVVLKDAKTDKEVNGTLTDADGNFKLTEIPTGTYTLVLSFIGYETKKVTGIELTPKKPDENLEVIYMRSTSVTLEEVEVKGEASAFENRIDKLVYNADKDITTLGGDATDVLQRVPLLSVDVEGNVSLRGSSNIQVLINGKPSTIFTSGDLANALRTIPADQIKSVEVITSPSAKYDGEGTAGIINIITKKKSIDGFTGSVSLSAGTRTNRGSLNLNYAKGRFGLNFNGSGWYNIPRKSFTEFFREDVIEGESRILDQNGEGRSNFFGPRFSLGAFYDINAYNSINTSINFRGFGRNNDQTTIATYIDPVQDLNQYYERISETSAFRSGFDWTTDYRKTFKKKEQEFSAAIQASGDYSNSVNDFDQRDTFPDVDPFLDIRNRNSNDGINLEYTGQVDYVHPFSDRIKLETGLKTIIRRIESDFESELFDFDQEEFVTLPNQTDVFFYNQDVYAAYASVNWKLGEKYGLVAGARYEFTDISGRFETDPTRFSNNYGNFLPSIILNRKLSQFSNIKIAYNQRIQRPSLRTVNPYVDLSDPRDIRFGNPLLEPELTHQTELSYNTFVKGWVFNGSVYYRHTKDEIDPITTVDSIGRTVTTFQNIGRNDVVGINFFTSYTIKKFLTLRGGMDVQNITAAGLVDDVETRRNAWEWRANLNATFSLPKDFKIELFGFYNSPRQSLQGSRGAYSQFSIGAAKDLWNKRGSIGFSVIQPFTNTLSFPRNISGPDFTQRSNFEIEIRSFNLNFSYRFGKLDFKDRRSRRSKINNDDIQNGGGGIGG